MNFIKTSLNISKTIRNVGRLKEILTIFAKNGFDEFISRGITSNIPDFVLPRSKVQLKAELDSSSKEGWSYIIGLRLKKCFEELGPVFIKFGQLLSSREDIFDPAFIKQMQLLRDKVKGVPFDEAKEVIESSLGSSVNEVFREIDHTPIGTASIGVAFGAVLLDGTEVVVKVRRPNILKMVETDVSILLFLISQLERVSVEIKYLGISRLVRDFAISLQSELNFNIEALNCIRLTKNVEKHDRENVLYFPKVYTQYSSEEILVLERIRGLAFSDIEAVRREKSRIEMNLAPSLQIFVKTFLQDGFFHADLHGGNFFLQEDGRIAIIDFGLMGSLSRKSRLNFIAIIYSMISYNFENLVYEFLDVAEYDAIPNIDELVLDIRDGLAPFMGLSVAQTNYSEVMSLIISALVKHKVYLPREWFIVFRALMTLDGVAKSIGVDANIFELMEESLRPILKKSLKKEELVEDAIWAGRDILSSVRIFPRHLKWFIKEWARKNYAFEIVHKGHEESVKKITGSINFLALSMLTSILILSGVMAIGGKSIETIMEIPVISLFFWGMAFIIFIRGLLFLKR